MKPKFINFLVALALAAFATPAAAQFDHVNCYKVSVVRGQFVVNAHAKDPLVLRPEQVPPFAVTDGCVLNPKPILGVLTVRGGPVLIEVPAYKTETPPPTGCDQTAVGQCGGQCPTGLSCKPSAAAPCACG